MGTHFQGLMEAFQKEKDDTSFSKRALAVILVKVKKIPIDEVAEIFGCVPKTIRNWLNRYKERGINGLRDRPKTGRPRKISKLQILAIVLHMPQKHPIIIKRIIYDLTKIEYSVWSIRRVLRELKLTRKKPKPYYINRASAEDTQIFQDRVLLKIQKAKRKGIPVFVCDEVQANYDDNCNYMVWEFKWKDARVPYVNQYESVRYFGALDSDGNLFTIQYEDNFTADMFRICLNMLYDKCGKFMIIADGAKAHTANNVKEFCEKKGIDLEILPAGRPELNAIETIWYMGKKEHVNGKFYPDRRELVSKLNEFFSQKFDIDLVKYLKRKVDD